MNRHRFVVCAVVAVSLSGCAASERGASFSGTEAPPRSQPYEVAHVASLPAGYRSIGRVRAACRAIAKVTSLDERRLSDVGCTRERLILALEARAANVGGDALYELSCRGRDVNDMERANVSCSARVARAEGVPTRDRDASGAQRSAHGDDPTGLDAWTIRVSFAGSTDYAPRPVRHPELVVERAIMPASHLALGVVTTECPMTAEESVCSPDAVRAGLRIAAARVGASDVVAPRCFQGSVAFTCVGTAAGVREPAADPESWR